MSTWTVRVPAHPTEAYDISTDAPLFSEIYASLPPGYKIYTLVDALKWVGYRMTVGDEIVTLQEALTCPGCGDPCVGEWVDFGIGAYEYWGAPGIDVQMAYVSNCCEAQLPNRNGPTMSKLWLLGGVVGGLNGLITGALGATLWQIFLSSVVLGLAINAGATPVPPQE